MKPSLNKASSRQSYFRCAVYLLHTSSLVQEVISLVSKEGLVMESQAGRSVGYRQALEYLRAVWGFPPNAGGTEAVPQEVMHTSFWEFLATYKARTR